MASNSEDLDPRIQIELENLNTATDEINKLEIELEEANSTFRILLNESTRRLKLLSKKLGSCIEKARPYYEALEKAKDAQVECQKAAVKFQRANEIHAAAKETVALAEKRFMSNSHEWQFDNAWQEMLNHATAKVMDAENKKAESHAEHQRKAQAFNAAELKVQQLEDRLRRNIQKSRPYFEEKQICQDQLHTQKSRIQELQGQLQGAKGSYSTALRNLEHISEEIHKKRGDLHLAAPPGPREPGVGAELCPVPDYNLELDKCEFPSMGSVSSLTASSVQSERDAESDDTCLDDDGEDYDLEALRRKVKTLAVRPVEGGDGQQEQDVWESELNATVDKLDHLMMMKECAAMNSKITVQQQPNGNDDPSVNSMPATPDKFTAIKQLSKLEPLPSVNVSMRELPLLARISNEISDNTCYHKQRRRSLN